MSRAREVLRGIAASPGVAVGEVSVMDSHTFRIPHRRIHREDTAHEVGRLRLAIEASRRELEDIRDRIGDDAPADYRLILDAHLMMHRDELLIDWAIQAIEGDEVSAEWAAEQAVGRIKRHLAQSTEDYFRDRAADVEHVGKRIIAELVGKSSSLPPMSENAILVIEDLHPADAAHLFEQPVAGLVTGLGSATSHTAILARTLEIPAVVGVTEILERAGSGDLAIVDGLRSVVVLAPEAQEIERAKARARRYQHFTRGLRARSRAQTESQDGVKVDLMANVDLPAEAALATEENAQGIGLYRTEFLFMNRQVPPNEDEQYMVYRDIAAVMGDRPVTLRTIDMGGDHLTLEPGSHSTPNPALGLRAIRLALAEPGLLETQLRAILRAAAHGKVRVMFPLVSGVGELRRARAALERAQQELTARREPFGQVEVGAMIELPSAVIMADQLAAESAFFSVGTNDLVQYTLAVDRSNPEVAYLADPLDPSVLRLLQMAVAAASRASIPIHMCGDMAADPICLPVVLGIGYRSLSVPLTALPLVREVLRRTSVQEARLLAQKALAAGTGQEVKALVEEHFEDALSELWEEAGLRGGSDSPPSG